MSSSPATIAARIAATHQCTTINNPVGVDDCAPGQFCVDASSVPSKCVILDNTVNFARSSNGNVCQGLN